MSYNVAHTSQGVMPSGYHVEISSVVEHSGWETFLLNTPGGHYVQSGLWARLKAFQGWQTRRIIITHQESYEESHQEPYEESHQGSIIAGMQILMRPLPMIGSPGGYIAQVPKAPVFASDDPRLVQGIMDELHRLARKHRIQYLLLQPPDNGEWLMPHLAQRGFRPAWGNIAAAATLRIDLTQDIDSIQQQIKRKVRYNIRLAERKEIRVREGTIADLPDFCALLDATRQRQQFNTLNETLLTEMWRIFSPRDALKLFMAEYNDEPVAAILAVRYKDTLFRTFAAWSGQHGERKPNVQLDWKAITWAKENGLRYYDFAGIDPVVARSMLNGESPSGSDVEGVEAYNAYKLGFGGEAAVYPETCEYIYNPLFRWMFTKVARNKYVQNWLEKRRNH